MIDLPMNIQRGDVKNPVYDISLDEMGFGAACESNMESNWQTAAEQQAWTWQ